MYMHEYTHEYAMVYAWYPEGMLSPFTVVF